MTANHFCWVFFLLNHTHQVMLPHSLGILPLSTARSSIEESGGYDYPDPYPAIDAATRPWVVKSHEATLLESESA